MAHKCTLQMLQTHRFETTMKTEIIHTARQDKASNTYAAAHTHAHTPYVKTKAATH